MKTIDLAHGVNAAFSEGALRQLSDKFGLSGELIQYAVSHAGPVLILSMMGTSVVADGAAVRALFSSIVSAEVNARITQELPDLVMTTEGLKQLEWAGQMLASRGSRCGFAVLSDYVAAGTGLPGQAGYAIMALAASVLWGSLKYHVLLEQGTVDQVPTLLSEQWPKVKGYLTDALAMSMRFDSAAEFADSIPGQLRVLSGRLKRELDECDTTASDTVAQETVIEAGLCHNHGRWSASLVALLGFAVTALLVVAWLRPDFIDSVVNRVVKRDPMGKVSVNYLPVPAPASTPIVAAGPASTIGSDGKVSPVTPSAASDGASTSAANAANETNVNTSVPSATAIEQTSASSVPAAFSSTATMNSASSVSVQAPIKEARIVWRVNAAGAPTVEAMVATAAEKARLLDGLNRKPIAGRFKADIAVDTSTRPAEWLAHLNDVLPLMALPHADVSIQGKQVELGGSAADEHLGWRNFLVSRLGSTYHVEDFAPGEAVVSATTLFEHALAKRGSSGAACEADDVVKVLKLQVVDFAGGSGQVPASAIKNLSESARLLKACADSGKPVKLEIAVFSDNTGNPQANLELSKKRADAVRTYLVQAGAPADLLSAEGFGAAHPIADNLTSRGRFENRRVEFNAQ